MLISPDICSELTDQEIVSKSLEDIDYFSCLYQKYELKLLRYIKRITSVSLQEAEDILQDSFVKIWKNLNGYDANMKLSSWVYRIVHNETVSHWRKDKWARNNPFLEIDQHILKTIASDMEISESGPNNIKAKLEKIDSKYREILVLKYFEEMSYEEISDVLKIPEGTVATRINRAKKALKSIK